MKKIKTLDEKATIHGKDLDRRKDQTLRMTEYELIAPCHFGLESVLKQEITSLGYPIKIVEDGKVSFVGGVDAIARANIFLRSTERILINIGQFHAESFDELFENTKALPWEEYLPKDGKFWVAKANSVRSKLFSPSDIQSIVKKAIVERLKGKYQLSWFEETGESFPLRVSILKDIVTIGLDTSGESLHKRGYRKLTPKAPISETLAAALIKLTPWNESRHLVDPFCGSGTIPIEAAMMGANIAPGMNREFLSNSWDFIPKKTWYRAYDEAKDLVRKDIEMDIQGYDINPEVVSYARQNAKLAGVDKLIHFQQRSVSALSHPSPYGFVITNPPYGERLEEKEALRPIYADLGKAMKTLNTWSFYLITSYEEAQKDIGKQADKNRKIYNGMLKTYFYQYPGPKPPKKKG